MRIRGASRGTHFDVVQTKKGDEKKNVKKRTKIRLTYYIAGFSIHPFRDAPTTSFLLLADRSCVNSSNRGDIKKQPTVRKPHVRRAHHDARMNI